MNNEKYINNIKSKLNELDEETIKNLDNSDLRYFFNLLVNAKYRSEQKEK